MATTIQIKRGTGSAVPSGLADGELAINLDNGKLFFGSGSTSINSFTFENLTAENYIVSSSVTNITTQTLSGSTAFGDSADDTHQFTGAITASNDISASGNITGQDVLSSRDIISSRYMSALGYISSSASLIGNEVDVRGHITASGDISSSGTITANSFTGNGLSIDGPSNSHVEVGEYIVGVDFNTVFGDITGSGLIISGAMADTDHHNMLKIGNVELIDLNTAVSTNEFLIHNVSSFKITSGSDGGDVANETNNIFVHNGHEFFLCKGGEATANATIHSSGTTTKIVDGTVQIDASVCSIKAPNDTPPYIMGFEGNPNSNPSIVKSIESANIFPALGGAVTASAVSSSGTITAAAAVLTTADINGGTIDGITSLTAGGNLDIGAHDLRAATLTADGLTSGRVVFAGTAGVLSDDADLTFATDTLTVTKIANVNSTSHITASGNISSSGTIIANHVNVDSSITFAGSKRILYNTDDENLVIQDSSLKVNSHITASGNISSSGTIIAGTLDAAAVSDTLAAAIVAEIDNDEIPIAKLAEDSISGVALGSNLNNLTVDDATLQLNSGTTYNGSAARTISIKDGGVDSDALADDITVAGDLTVAADIIHSGDTNTKIRFVTDAVRVDAGGTAVFNSSTTGSVLPMVHQNVYDTGSLALNANSAFGDIVKFGGSSTVAGGIYFLNSSGGWTLTQANAAATSTGSLAVAVGTNSTTHGMCLRGFVNPFIDPGAGIGAPVYLSDTHTGRMLATAPDSTNDVVRIIGYQYGTDLIYFNPSNDYIVHA